jgi:hypothetical protein
MPSLVEARSTCPLCGELLAIRGPGAVERPIESLSYVVVNQKDALVSLQDTEFVNSGPERRVVSGEPSVWQIPGAIMAALFRVTVTALRREGRGLGDGWVFPRCAQGSCGPADYSIVGTQFEGRFLPKPPRVRHDAVVEEMARCAPAPESFALVVVCRCGDLYVGHLNRFYTGPDIVRRVGKDGTLHPFMMRPRFRFTWIPDVTSSPILKDQRPL